MADAPGTALITGASAGIGHALAHLFVQSGHDVILVARRQEKLTEMQAQWSATYGVTVHVFAQDLSDPRAWRALDERLVREGLQVDYLVNNAGLGLNGPFSQGDVEGTMAMLHVNMTALVGLTRAILPRMLARGRGRILNVGSTAGFQPGPGMSVYYATKAFVYSFTEGLVGELRGTPVSATNLAPGPVDTEFKDQANMHDTLLFALGADTPQFVAKAGFEGMMRGKSLVVPGLKNKLPGLTARLAPRGILRRMTQRINADK